MLEFTVLLLHAGSESVMVTNHPLLFPSSSRAEARWSWYHGVLCEGTVPVVRSRTIRVLTLCWPWCEAHTAPGASASVCSWVVSWGSELSHKHQPLTYCHQSLCTKPEKMTRWQAACFKKTILNKRFLCPAAGIIEWTWAHLKDGSSGFFFLVYTIFPWSHSS